MIQNHGQPQVHFNLILLDILLVILNHIISQEILKYYTSIDFKVQKYFGEFLTLKLKDPHYNKTLMLMKLSCI